MKRRYLILVMLAVLGVVIYLLFSSGHDYRRDEEAYKKDLLAHGEKLTLIEVAQPLDTNDPAPAKRFMAFMSNYSLPTNFSTGMKIVEPGRALVLNSNLIAVELAGYGRNRSNVAALSGILAEGKLNFVLDYSMGVNMPLPGLARLKAAEQLLCGTALQAMSAGDLDEAFNDLRQGVRLARSSSNEPILISGLVRLAMAQIAMRVTWDILQEHRWTDRQLADLQKDWAGMNLYDGLRKIMRTERATGIDAFAKARQQPNGADLLGLQSALSGFTGSGTSGGGGGLGALKDKIKEWYDDYPRFWRWRRAWSYEDELDYLKRMEIISKTVDRQIESDSFSVAYAEMGRSLTNLGAAGHENTNHLLLANLLFGAISNCLQKTARGEVARRITVTAIALERYHFAHGAYPDKLEQLVPDFLATVPSDFMDGKPLRYSLRKDGTFLLYSVGENGEDDGGDPSGGMPDWTRGLDIVWPSAITTNAPLAR